MPVSLFSKVKRLAKKLVAPAAASQSDTDAAAGSPPSNDAVASLGMLATGSGMAFGGMAATASAYRAGATNAWHEKLLRTKYVFEPIIGAAGAQAVAAACDSAAVMTQHFFGEYIYAHIESTLADLYDYAKEGPVSATAHFYSGLRLEPTDFTDVACLTEFIVAQCLYHDIGARLDANESPIIPIGYSDYVLANHPHWIVADPAAYTKDALEQRLPGLSGMLASVQALSADAGDQMHALRRMLDDVDVASTLETGGPSQL